jgi:hypothetical protein
VAVVGVLVVTLVVVVAELGVLAVVAVVVRETAVRSSPRWCGPGGRRSRW